MKSITLTFLIHQPFRLTKFPFYKIGNGDEVFDDELNASILREESKLYLKLNQLLLQLIESHPGKFNFNFCISGTALEQFETFVPEVLESFWLLLRTGSMELVGTTYGNSLAAIVSRSEFSEQVKSHSNKLMDLFGVSPKAFLISKYAYTEVIGDILTNLGYRSLIFEDEKPDAEYSELNQVFSSPFRENGVILWINQVLSKPLNIVVGLKQDQVIPSTAKDFIDQLLSLPDAESLVNLNLNYSFLGKYPEKAIQLLKFFESFVSLGLPNHLQFLKFSSIEIDNLIKSKVFPYGFNHSPDRNNQIKKNYLGNYLQQDAFYALYDLEDRVKSLNNPDIIGIWTKLQSSDHFYYMNTNYSEGNYSSPIFSPYIDPIQAYINYMNVITDLGVQIENLQKKDQFQKVKIIGTDSKSSIHINQMKSRTQRRISDSSIENPSKYV